MTLRDWRSWTNAGTLIPAGICRFSGCKDRVDRLANGRWPTCRKHADRIEGVKSANSG